MRQIASELNHQAIEPASPLLAPIWQVDARTLSVIADVDRFCESETLVKTVVAEYERAKKEQIDE